MEFTYSQTSESRGILHAYTVQLILNPQDLILRFEHSKTFRAYEQTFFERDFPSLTALGGLDFVGKLLSLGFSSKQDVKIEDFKESPTKISLDLVYSSPVLVNPLRLSFTIPALRKQSGGTSDVETLARKVKELSENFAKVLEEKLESLQERIGELEERCGDTVVIPGCDSPIPVSSTSLTLLRNQTCLPKEILLALYTLGCKRKGIIIFNQVTHNQSLGIHHLVIPSQVLILVGLPPQTYTLTQESYL